MAVDALAARASPVAIHAALEAATPLVTLSARGAASIPGLAAEAARRGGLVVLGCGHEPGLTEILARRLAERLDRVDGHPGQLTEEPPGVAHGAGSPRATPGLQL